MYCIQNAVARLSKFACLRYGDTSSTEDAVYFYMIGLLKHTQAQSIRAEMWDTHVDLRLFGVQVLLV